MQHSVHAVVILTLFLLLGHVLGSVFSLYEEVFWFDMLMHALGGAWLAAILLTVGARRFPRLFMDAPFSDGLRRLILAVVLMGMAWELYEFGFAFYATTAYGNLGFYQTWGDTVFDLILDAAGAALAGTSLLRTIPRSVSRGAQDPAL